MATDTILSNGGGGGGGGGGGQPSPHMHQQTVISEKSASKRCFARSNEN